MGVDIDQGTHAACTEPSQHLPERVETPRRKALRGEAVLEGRAAAHWSVHNPVADRDPHCVDAERLRSIEHLVGIVAVPVVAHRLERVSVAVRPAHLCDKVELAPRLDLIIHPLHPHVHGVSRQLDEGVDLHHEPTAERDAVPLRRRSGGEA